MSRKTNEELYVPFKKDGDEGTAFEKFSKKRGLPPIKSLLLCVLCTFLASALIVGLLMICGLRLMRVGEARYFGFIGADGASLGIIQFENGGSATVGGGGIFYSDGSLYKGELNGLMPEGQGTLTFADGGYYAGQFKNGLYDGFGKLSLADGLVYEGEFKDGKFSGFGTLKYADGSAYSGAFYEGELHGNGVMSYYDGSVFEGSFVFSQRSVGTYTWKSGESISGIFKNNIPDPNEYFSYDDGDGGSYYVKIKNGAIVERVAYDPNDIPTDDEDNSDDSSDNEEVAG